jgi:ElaB/YqjD/DUF883 family membrane-anchored ribosome-binding protein
MLGLSHPALAQGPYRPARPDSVLNVLIGQRFRLYRDWSANQQERNALFGGQSKNDLRRIITTLERILAKDNEILAELNRLKEQETTELRRKNSDIVQRSNSYLVETSGTNEQMQRMEALVKRERERAKTAEAERERTVQIAVAAGLGLLALGWFVGRRRY